MASYKNNGGELVFPALFDANGDVLVVKAGASFVGPDGLVIDGVESVSVVSEAKSDSVAPSVDAPISAEPVVDQVTDPATPVEETK